jgi:N-acetylglucosamine kinase-like BadF-type ATPase
LVSQAETGPSNHLLVDAPVVATSLAKAIDQALKLGNLDRDAVACVSAGLAGVDFDGNGASQMEDLLRQLGFENQVVNGDMTIAHAGALLLQPGVVALAGTGSVVLGVDADDKRVKVGGWGPIYGDEGSAYRIGEMALRAAAKAYDKRGPATRLNEALLASLGLNEFRESVTQVYVKGMEPRDIAALSRVAYEVAETGDEVARSIFFQAGDELADSVEAAIRQLNFQSSEVKVSHQGSVMSSCRLIRERFIGQLQRRVPGLVVVSPEFEPVIGAYLLGSKALGWEVDENVHEALKRNSTL